MTQKSNNINFIATYIFENPGCSASNVRRALYVFKNKKLDCNFSERKSYTSYFHQPTTGEPHRGYAGKYWKKINRTRWVITEVGLEKIDKKLIKKVQVINKKLCRKSKKRLNYRCKKK